VAGSILRRATLLLTAVAFLLVTVLPNAISVRAMPAQTPCEHCPDKAPTGGNLGKMACGALACAGVTIGLPARHAPYLPAFAKFAYAAGFVPAIVGAPPTPDPYPPRPVVLG
jgi:hypothetical protein